jgi:rSAM/selenodomain-associated transferase 2
MARLSVIIPCLNEANCIERTLASLQPLRSEGHEVIVSDGGSNDGTTDLAHPLADRIVTSPQGRATQMNRGAAAASGDILWFLHADTEVPAHAHTNLIAELTAGNRAWGRFNIRLSGTHTLLRLIETMINLRSRLTGIATGDQGMFMWRQAFEEVGGFDEIPLMEDIAMSRKLKGLSRPLCLKQRIVSSSRRWEDQGIVKTIILMWRLRLAYFLGASPQTLANRYYP